MKKTKKSIKRRQAFMESLVRWPAKVLQIDELIFGTKDKVQQKENTELLIENNEMLKKLKNE
ncbi:MAG: hypothetical protein KAT43_01335 [Nanoarchaeota archaeon]|nr:hypothetical protein [Nanoarchaeota archaeon]